MAYIRNGQTLDQVNDSNKILGWRVIVSSRDLQLLTLSYFCFGYVAYIYFSWFFIYLSKVRGLDLKTSGLYATLPFLAMAIASPLGGFVSDRLTSRFEIGRAHV